MGGITRPGAIMVHGFGRRLTETAQGRRLEAKAHPSMGFQFFLLYCLHMGFWGLGIWLGFACFG